MTQKTSSGKSTAQAREDRLKAALKANMAKRKAQARARSAGTADEAKDNKSTSEGS
ncbi:hypothetical protein [Marivita geojedonensis]|uniref:hypothetical protein n=1 Tax=Marivita geojedonensis TaxID=1123756 RepID=UPI000D3F5827|nr:hypothetical protein [Marivita geojedonensis]PRY79218.1 hypothetical protein CLV76_105114 [Marivita geojedonensis]